MGMSKKDLARKKQNLRRKLEELEKKAKYDVINKELQKEVAERLCASAGTKAYGTLSVLVQLLCDAEIAFSVPAGAFRPAPKVESAVVVLDPRHPVPLLPAQRQALRHLLRTTFAQRRKQLANSLRALSDDPRALLAALGIDSERRPETLSPEDFLRLADRLADAARGADR